jgi:hypothetical protein
VIDETLRNLVRDRADDRCEYCRTPQIAIRVSLTVDHIIARQHGGKDEADNLALCCPACNLKKGPNLAGIDPKDGSITPLFHPRRENWNEHFRLNGAMVVGISASGRATIAVLDLNAEQRVSLRQSLIAEGLILPA